MTPGSGYPLDGFAAHLATVAFDDPGAVRLFVQTERDEGGFREHPIPWPPGAVQTDRIGMRPAPPAVLERVRRLRAEWASALLDLFGDDEAAGRAEMRQLRSTRSMRPSRAT